MTFHELAARCPRCRTVTRWTAYAVGTPTAYACHRCSTELPAIALRAILTPPPIRAIDCYACKRVLPAFAALDTFNDAPTCACPR